MSRYANNEKHIRQQNIVWKKATLLASKSEILLREDGFGGFYAQVPLMPRIFGHGHTLDECVENTRQILVATIAYALQFDASAEKKFLRMLTGKTRSSTSKKKTKKDTKKTTVKPTIDVAILTGMREELEPVLAIGGGESNWKIKRYKHFQYYIGVLPTKTSGGLRVVATSQWNYGPTRTSSEVNRLSDFEPRLLCMVGICAGWKGKDISLGDVIVAERAYQALQGRLEPGKHRPDIDPYHPPPYMVAWLKNFVDDNWTKELTIERPPDIHFQSLYLLLKMDQSGNESLSPEIEKRLESTWKNLDFIKSLLKEKKLITTRGRISAQGKECLASCVNHTKKHIILRTCKRKPKVHHGAFATLPYVLREDKFFESQAEHVRKIMAVDMELAAFFETCHEMSKPGIAAKAVCDYADPNKNDLFHPYAAEVSARYLCSFLAKNKEGIREL